MRLDIVDNKNLTHKEIATAIAWGSGYEVLTAGDDHKLIKWNIENEEGSTIGDFGESFYPTEMQWMPVNLSGNSSVRGGGPGVDILAIGTAEGKVWLLNRGGRVEKTVDAHAGAVLCVKWSWDGNAFLTAGEDGIVKIWSKGGMLRSSLAQSPVPVYGASWSPNSDQVLYTSGKHLAIKSIQPTIKPNVWKAHEGSILCLDWSAVTNTILSGAEDCRYKVWTIHGTPIYSSSPSDYPITSLAWSPDGLSFTVGSFETLKLCDRNGWPHSLEKLRSTGSILRLSWSPDGTQVAGVCANGRLLLTHLSGISVVSYHDRMQAVMTDERHIKVTGTGSGGSNEELLEFRDRIVKMAFQYSHLVVATSNSCYVYSTKNWNTPVVIELKESRLSLIVQSEKHFLLIDGSTMSIYSYEGRLTSSPKLPPSISPELLNNGSCCLASETVALLDRVNNNIYLVSTSTPGGRYLAGIVPGSSHHGGGSAAPHNIGPPAYSHSVSINEIGLEYSGKFLSVLDTNRDLFLFPVTTFRQVHRHGSKPSNTGAAVKLCGLITHTAWHESSTSLAALQSGSSRALVWPLPEIVFRDRNLISRAVCELPASSLYSGGSSSSGGSSGGPGSGSGSSSGQQISLHQFVGSSLIIRRSDSTLISCFVPSCIYAFHKLATTEITKDVVSLCRMMNVEYLWCCLAFLAGSQKNIEIAQIAYAALNDIERVEYLSKTMNLSNQEIRQAQLLILEGNTLDAENVLIQAGMLERAVLIHLKQFEWERALELTKTKQNKARSDGDVDLLELVLSCRKNFLEKMGKKETLQSFLNYQEKTLPDWDETKEVLKKIGKT